MKNRVGAHYVLCYHTPRSSAKEYNLQLGDKQYPVVSAIGEEDEYTDIIAV